MLAGYCGWTGVLRRTGSRRHHNHQQNLYCQIHRQAHDIDYESSVADPNWSYLAM